MPDHRVIERFLIGLAVVLAVTAGCRQEVSKKPVPRTTYTVVVGPSENEVNPESREIRSDTSEGGDRVHWDLIDSERHPDKKRKLYIEFERPDAFSEVTMNPNSHRFRVHCPDAASCDSGPIAKDASGTYKYWQIIKDSSGDEHPADGRIIIKP